MRHLPLPTALLLVAPLGAQTLSYLEGATPSTLQLRTVPEASPAGARATVLSGLEILPIEITNRTLQHGLRADLPRRLTDGDLPRIELPDNGRLLRYGRDGAHYGFLWVDAAGAPQVVLELPSLPPAGDPFLDRIGVAPDGSHAAIPTRAGQLWLVRLDGGVYASTGTPARALQTGLVEKVSVCVGPTHVWYVTATGRLHRCPLADGAPATDLTPGNIGGEMEDNMAPAEDGRSVAFLYGPKKSESLWLIGTQGPAVKLPPPPADYEEPAYLPEVRSGPALMLDTDGSRLLYDDSTVRDEWFLLDTSGATATTHLTSDENFEPYIGIGVWPSFVADTIVIALGDPGRFDWIEGTTSSPAVVNVTRTAPEPSPPFSSGKLLPLAGYQLASGAVLTEEVDTELSSRLRALDPATSTTHIVTRDLRGTPALGEGPAGPTVMVPSDRGDLLLNGALAVELAAPRGVLLEPESAPPAGGWSVFVARVPGAAAAILRLASGAVFAIPDAGLRDAYATPGGNLLLDSTSLVHVAPGAATTLSTAPVRHALSRN